jgi:dienelactone hydrolase
VALLASPALALATPSSSSLSGGGVVALAQRVASAGGELSDIATTPAVASGRLVVSAAEQPPAWPFEDRASSADTGQRHGRVPVGGWVAWPRGATPSVLVLYAHGCCGVPDDQRSAMVAIATRLNVVAVAMDFRDAARYAPDLAAEDSAAAVEVLQRAVPSVRTTAAWGFSEGGAVTGLLIEHHPGLVDVWVDQSGAVDLAPVLASLRTLAWGTTQVGLGRRTAAATLLTLVAQAVQGDPVARSADLSPSQHVGLLRGLRRAVLLYAQGDPLVPASSGTELATQLRALGVPVTLLVLTPAKGQPAVDVSWHTAPALFAAAAATVGEVAAGRDPGLGPTDDRVVPATL